MSGRNHLLTTGWLLVASAVIITAGVMLSRAPIRGSDDALVGKSVATIQIKADWSQEWTDENGTIALFRGNCRIEQGNTHSTADSMVIWAHRSDDETGKVERLSVYLEGDVRIEDLNGARNESSHSLELDAARGITLTVRGRTTDRPGEDDPLYKRAVLRKFGPSRSKLRQTQLTVPVAAAQPTQVLPGLGIPGAAGTRRIRVSPRSMSSPFNIHSELSTDTTPYEQVTRITGGVNILIEGIPLENGIDLGVIDLSADRVVIWTDDFQEIQQQSTDQKYQIYLEGNIEVRQRDNERQIENVIKASRAYYDIRDHRATILDGELDAYIAQLDTSVRLRADRIMQNSEKNFHAQNGWVTTSQYGVPGYRIQSSDIYFESRDQGLFANDAPPRVNPQTGTVIPEDHYWITALNTQFLVDQFPLFNIPRVSVPAEDITTSTPLRTGSVGFDRIFGAQLRTTWDVFSLFSLNRPQNPDTTLLLNVDYLSNRGVGAGLQGNYKGTDDYGRKYFGTGFGSYFNDSGVDNLGADRRSLVPPTTNRGLFQLEHEYDLDDINAKLFGELSSVSDRNVQEQYRERLFDTGKDLETKLQFNQNLTDNIAYTVLGRTQLNWYDNNTQWLPRGDLYVLGEPILGNLINYSSHSSVGYGVMTPAAAPTDPQEVFTPLPYYQNASGLVAQSRHEVELPFNLGALKVAPYALGEAAYWGDSMSGDPISRLYGRGGFRSSISFQRVFPNLQSEIFNLNGLVHKSQVDVDYSISGSTRRLNDILQWNEFDDNAQERFRMRFVQDTFGGVLPVQFDPRFYAVRSGAGSSVTAPYGELVDSQQVARFNWHQRLQTRVGPPNLQRVKDWMTLDLGASVFPDSNRDNFGQTFGLVNSRYAWHVGDRTSILASSLYDFFPEGQQLWSVGVLTQRSLRGSVYVGLRQVKGGPLDSQIATVTLSEVLSPKWVVSATTGYDIAQSRSAGQGFTITRVGEWLLVHVGANIDVSKNNVGMGISLEPRLGRGAISSTQLGSLLGVAQPQY
ncbi:hypothetical protein [Schlesneria paludicola]|uniref:hypothetical protein n=1 Tax=Schlesneria paludicola TaxID=360056 RepID=UPI0012F960F5|nr:hypothetical protein [Schlesneria paludicola]